jgi:hypothetical protein
LQLRVVELPGLHPALGRALGEAGEGAPRIRELLAESVRVRCVGCGIAVTPDELESLALASSAPEASPRLERLRLGYCARNGCDSRFYLASADTGMVLWPLVFRRTRELLGGKAEPEPSAGVAAPEAAPPTFKEQWRRVQLAVLGGVLALVLLLWWWQHGARIPGITPAPRDFTVAPAEPSPGQTAARPASGGTNVPRGFQVR